MQRLWSPLCEADEKDGRQQSICAGRFKPSPEAPRHNTTLILATSGLGIDMKLCLLEELCDKTNKQKLRAHFMKIGQAFEYGVLRSGLDFGVYPGAPGTVQPGVISETLKKHWRDWSASPMYSP